MKLKLFRHLWGIAGSWEDVFPLILADGYAGIECGLPKPDQSQRFASLLATHAFEFIAQIFTAGASVDQHLESFRAQLQRAQEFRPILVNCHSGRDAWTTDEAETFYRRAIDIESSIGVPVAHETHRGRTFYNPWITAQMLRKFDALKLCCDLSHWVCVCERLLDDEAILRLCAEHCLHIHARVGYEEGPQVPDPSAPEYRQHLEAHERWWDLIWSTQQSRGMPFSTLTPEFGPPQYLHTLPHTNVPVADLWKICNWQANRQRQRFNKGDITPYSAQFQNDNKGDITPSANKL